jgi:hypothetical protein
MGQGRSFAAFYFKDGRMLAVDAVNKPQEFMLAKRVIANGLAVDRARLADEGTALRICSAVDDLYCRAASAGIRVPHEYRG